MPTKLVHMLSSGRHAGEAQHFVEQIWRHLSLPSSAVSALTLDHAGPYLPSSFKVAALAQSSVALSALSAALVYAQHNDTTVPEVSVSRQHAQAAFASEQLYLLDGKPAGSSWGALGGLHEARSGHVRMHDSLPNHRAAALQVLGLPPEATREDVAASIKQWDALDLEQAAMSSKGVIFALRSFQQWDRSPQAASLTDQPISLRKIGPTGPSGFAMHMPKNADRALRGLRVLELSRVIAAPVAGRTLAAHGADVLWITSPRLPSLPDLDIDTSRGKRSVHLDLNSSKDLDTLRHLITEADVFIQSYRPSSLAAKGLGPNDIAAIKPGIVYADLSAWGHEGPWKEARGFDSIVQTVTGLNTAEAEIFDPSGDTTARALPVQALDHAAGYLLATGICAALYRRNVEGGSWQVSVSLAGVGKYLRNLGQQTRAEGFEGNAVKDAGAILEDEMTEEKETGFGKLRAVKYPATVEGLAPGFDNMPQAWGSAEPRWL